VVVLIFLSGRLCATATLTLLWGAVVATWASGLITPRTQLPFFLRLTQDSARGSLRVDWRLLARAAALFLQVARRCRLGQSPTFLI
jgi:hypothetical protein